MSAITFISLSEYHFPTFRHWTPVHCHFPFRFYPPSHLFLPLLKTLYKMARSIPLREALREAMNEEMRRDDRVFLMGEEVAEYNGAYKVSQGMLAEFGPKRVIDTPISELAFTAVGVGAAQNGLRPIVEFMTWNFANLALDSILNTASKMLAMSGGQIGCPIVFRGPNGAAGQLGAQHSTAFDNLF